MKFTITDEKQTGTYRLLILDKEPDAIPQHINIGSHRYETTYLHGLKKAIAIFCARDVQPLKGMIFEI